MRRTRRSRSAGVAFAAVVLALAIATLSTPVAAKVAPVEAPVDDKKYPANQTTLAYEFQNELYTHQCYGNKLGDGQLDAGKFGKNSRRAMWIFVQTWNDKFGAGTFATAAKVLDEIRSARVTDVSVTFCLGSSRLSEWFDSTEHDPSLVPTGQTGLLAVLSG